MPPLPSTSSLPRILMGGKEYVLQSWFGLGTLMRAGPGCYGPQVVYEPTFELDGNHVVLRSLEQSPNYGYRSRSEAGEIGEPIPFTGGMLVSFTPTPQARADYPEWLSLNLREGCEDLVLATDIRNIVFTNGALVSMRLVTTDFARLLKLLERKSEENLTAMRELVERRPLPRREARALLEAIRAEAANEYRRWAEASSISADQKLKGPASHVAVGRAADLFHDADRRAWAERPRAQREVDGPILVEASRPLFDAARKADQRRSRVAGSCPRCAKETELRVCRREGFVLCDDCWFVWW